MPLVGSIIKRAFQLGVKLQRNRLNPREYQVKTLRRLLKKSSKTAFGQYFDFKNILKSTDLLAQFQQNVPFHDYDTIYEKWWHRALSQESDISWKGKVKYFALSSGTSGAPSKHIPVTEDMIRSIRKAGVKMFFCLTQYDVDTSLYAKDMMMLGGCTDLEEKDGFFVGDLSGINASRRPFWLRRTYKPGGDISKINNWDDRIEEIVKNAPNWDIGFIMGIPAWNQLMMERIIEHYQLETIHDIWPNLKVFVHGGVAFQPYRKSFERLMGKPMLYMDTYLASEGFVAFQTRPDTTAMAMILNNGIFFEFIPFNEEYFEDGMLKGQPQALMIDEVVEGVDYALVMSTNAGAWRYLIGDVVRFVDKSKHEIVITGRTKHFLSICGEHLSVDNMNRAIQKVEEDLDCLIQEFTVSGIEKGTFFAHKWYIGMKQQTVDADKVKERLDFHLKKVNDDYATERSAVLDIEVEIVPSALFYKWQESRGKIGGQNKFPRVMKSERFNDWEAFVKDCSIEK